MIHYIVSQLPGAAVGFVVAAFTPAIGRFLKKTFVTETAKIKADAKSAEVSIAKNL